MTPIPPSISGAAALPLAGHRRDAISILDELLTLPGALSGEETDLLLDLRWHLRHRGNAEAALRVFCDVRRRLEQRHYLALFRIRRWLQSELQARVRLCPRGPEKLVPLRLDFYCVEAVRRGCLCAALEEGGTFGRLRLRFAFRASAPAAPLAELP